MAREILTLDPSEVLREALGLPARGEVDYFMLFGVARKDAPGERIDNQVMGHSRVLRQWQNSEEYGQEAVALLRVVQRAAHIMRDEGRRAAYLQALERQERGEAQSGAEIFAELVRAALGIGQLTEDDRRQLGEAARQHGLEPEQARAIIEEQNRRLKQERQSEAAEAPGGAGEEGWEFRLAEGGELGFRQYLDALERDGCFPGSIEHEDLIKEAANQGIVRGQAEGLIREFERTCFRRMVKRVAGAGAITEAQARLMLPKATQYGLDMGAALEIIQNYRLTAHTPEDVLQKVTSVQSIEDDEIDDLIEKTRSVEDKRSFWHVLNQSLPMQMRNIVLVLLGILGLVGGWILWGSMGGPAPEGATPIVRRTPSPEAPGLVDESAPPATPTPNAQPENMLVRQPDPADGFIRLDPAGPEDPPAFAMAIREVTCAEYSAFCRATLEPVPPGWNGPTPPAGWDDLPVTRISWGQARGYAQWVARQRGWSATSLRLPTHAEYRRALHGRTIRGNPADPGYWRRARLGQFDSPQPVATIQWDMIFVPGKTQIYDLIGNVAEWGRDQRSDLRIVLGGDYTQTSPDTNHLAPRWLPMDELSPRVGFRLVRELESN